MTSTNFTPATPEGTHRRRNPLTGEWVLVAPGRDRRPWSGQTEAPTVPTAPSYHPDCYLCPRNTRVSGDQNPNYESTYVFTNDFAAIKPESSPPPATTNAIFETESVRGTCRVICFSPRHDLRMADMSADELAAVIELWCDQHRELSAEWRWVQVFENRGSEMGASNPHPHGQIWASDDLPTLVAREDERQRTHFEWGGTRLLDDYLAVEEMAAERLVVANDHWAVVVPYWAVWPFETLLIARGGIRGFGDLTSDHKAALGEILRSLLGGYDNLMERPFPYSMGWHPAPADADGDHWVMHAHFLPPLLRPDARKFMVGYELMAEPQRDLTPEDAAGQLRDAIASSPSES